VRIYGTQSASSGFSLQEFEVYRAEGQPSIPPGETNIVWVEDNLPTGAVPGAEGGDSWNWVSNNPVPFSGNLANQSTATAGMHQHFFTGATDTLTVHTNDSLFAYVYLNPTNAPSQIMLQWNDGSWEHRAFWGANNITFGVLDTASRRNMGPLPAAGQWTKLLVPASQVGLEGSTLSGMAFTQFDGQATWDYAGRQSPDLPTLRLTSLTISSNGAKLTWFSTPGSVYQVKQKAHLPDANWADASGEITASNTVTSWVDVTAPSSDQRYYQLYRVR
jgi:hypothetical protein